MLTRLAISTYQVLILTLEELHDLLFRRRAMISLILYFLGIGGLVVLIGYLEKRVFTAMPAMADAQTMLPIIRQQMHQFGLGREIDLILRLKDLPGAALIIHILSLLWYPSLVSLISCDMVATDIYRGTLRFLLTRTGRTTYYFSKMAAHFFFYVVIQLLTLLAVYLTCAYAAADFNAKAYLATIAMCMKVFLPYLLFVVATTQYVSCSADKPARVILKLHSLWALFIVLAWLAPLASPLNGEIVLGLIAPFGEHGLLTARMLCLWATGFTAFGLWSLWRRAL